MAYYHSILMPLLDYCIVLKEEKLKYFLGMVVFSLSLSNQVKIQRKLISQTYFHNLYTYTRGSSYIRGVLMGQHYFGKFF